MPGQPNVIVVVTDQQRWDTTGVHGNPLDLTPTYDRIATHGTHLANAFTPNPVCAPARAALQTGRYPTANGVYRNSIPLPADSRTIAQCFADAGYTTGNIGKWHLADENPVPAEKRFGYHHWLTSNILEFTSDAYHTTVYDENDEPVALPGYRSDALFDAAIRFVADRSTEDAPFFLFLALMEPHHQNELDNYPAPEGYEERYQGRWMPPDLATLSAEGGTAYRHMGGYCGQIKRVDEGLARLLDSLRSLGILDDTIVAYTADHGSHFKTRNKEYKRSCHDASIRVPFAIRGPGFDGGGRLDAMVSTVDLPPTLLDAAGIEVPPAMQGRSFLPLLHGRGGDWPEEAFVQISESEVGRAIRNHRWAYAVTAPDRDAWNDAGSPTYVESSLYDLEADPWQLTNLIDAPAHRAVADKLRERLVQRMVEAGEEAPTITPAAVGPRRGQRIVDPHYYGMTERPTRFGHQPPRSGS